MKILKYAVDVAVGDDADVDTPGLGHAIELVLVEQLRQVKAAEVKPVEAWGASAPAPGHDDSTTSGPRGPSTTRVESGGEPRKKRKYVRKTAARTYGDAGHGQPQDAPAQSPAQSGLVVVERRGHVPAGGSVRGMEGL